MLFNGQRVESGAHAMQYEQILNNQFDRGELVSIIEAAEEAMNYNYIMSQ